MSRPRVNPGQALERFPATDSVTVHKDHQAQAIGDGGIDHTDSQASTQKDNSGDFLLWSGNSW